VTTFSRGDGIDGALGEVVTLGEILHGSWKGTVSQGRWVKAAVSFLIMLLPPLPYSYVTLVM
jgi:hypothetical protein